VIDFNRFVREDFTKWFEGTQRNHRLDIIKRVGETCQCF
jgi:hypothetical protein